MFFQLHWCAGEIGCQTRECQGFAWWPDDACCSDIPFVISIIQSEKGFLVWTGQRLAFESSLRLEATEVCRRSCDVSIGFVRLKFRCFLDVRVIWVFCDDILCVSAKRHLRQTQRLFNEPCDVVCVADLSSRVVVWTSQRWNQWNVGPDTISVIQSEISHCWCPSAFLWPILRLSASNWRYECIFRCGVSPFLWYVERILRLKLFVCHI